MPTSSRADDDFSSEGFRRALGRIAPHVDNAVTSFASVYGLAPVVRRDQPPKVLWQAGDETMVEFVYRASGPSDVLVHDIGLLGDLKKTLRSRRLRVQHTSGRV